MDLCVSKICRDNGKSSKSWRDSERGIPIRDGLCDLKGEVIGLCRVKDMSDKIDGWYVHQDLIAHVVMWCYGDNAIDLSKIMIRHSVEKKSGDEDKRILERLTLTEDSFRR